MQKLTFGLHDYKGTPQLIQAINRASINSRWILIKVILPTMDEIVLPTLTVSKITILQRFSVSTTSQGISSGCYILCLPSSSFCNQNCENSKTSKHMLPNTAHVEFDFFTKFLNVFQCQFRHGTK